MNPRFRHFLFVLLALGLSAVPLRAQFKFGNGGGDGRWSNRANWTGRAGGYPSAAGIGAEMATTDLFTTLLDVNATVGSLRNTAGSARVWTINGGEDVALTLDNAGGVNYWGKTAAEIRAHSSGGLLCSARLRLHKAGLDVGTTGSTHTAAQVTLSGAIVADEDAVITVRNNHRRTYLSGDIGTEGEGAISLVNLSSSSTSDAEEANQLVVSGNLGRKVARLVQGEGICPGMIVTGANPDFRGQVTVLANSLTVEGKATLGDFNTVVVARGGKLVLQTAGALGTRACLEIDCLGSVALNYTGARAVDALSLDGGMTFASPGSTWGAPGSGAGFESAQLQGTGLLRVAPAAAR